MPRPCGLPSKKGVIEMKEESLLLELIAEIRAQNEKLEEIALSVFRIDQELKDFKQKALLFMVAERAKES
jgi:hypothetical protein